ncbi:hypothetical protein DPMN_142886 [Dreissena polymorpha]|uniref:Uncharacterized protein n=1 Tax=Dreissena polymorpha TaxID=45954 RepID=A0A9D4GC48_DREPO|nr:hypothetical protein DPMN_142886 [Dreissena polymorpha]
MSQGSTGTNGNDLRGNGKNRYCTGNNRGLHRSSTGAKTDPCRAKASLVNADRIPV